MKLTVTTPCYNELRFVRGWCENILGWSDLAIISEGGSTDGTRDVLSDYASKYPGRFIILDHEQSADPQRYGFREGERRQQLADMVTEGVQVLCDVDEMLPDDFREIVKEDLPPEHCGWIEWLNFWRSPCYIRVGTPDDPTWGPGLKPLLYPAQSMRWTIQKNHSEIICMLPTAQQAAAKLHYHYLFSAAKCFENRIAEFKGILGVAGVMDIHLRRARVEHPRAFGCLVEHVRFADLLQEQKSWIT